MCLPLVAQLAMDRSASNRSRSIPFRARVRAARAFSLLDVLVAMAIIAVLGTCLTRALAQARSAARSVATDSTLRQHLTVFQMYLQDHRDTHPWFGKPINGKITLSLPDSGAPFEIYYFVSSWAWPIPLAGYYGGVWPHPSQHYPGRDRTSAYLYSCAMIAEPEFWNERTRRGPSQWRATRAGDVLFPAEKALLVASISAEPYPPWIQHGLSLGLSDGSARFVAKPSLRLPLASGDGPFPGCFHVLGYYGLDTQDGIRGRDIER